MSSETKLRIMERQQRHDFPEDEVAFYRVCRCCDEVFIGRADREFCKLCVGKPRSRSRAVAVIAVALAVVAFLLIPLLCQAGERETIAIAAARVKWGMSQRPTMPDRPPAIKNKNLPTKSIAINPGLHSHKCPYDGTEWWHGEDQFGKAASHACPKCGRVQWAVSQQAPKAAPVIAPKVMQSNVCPPGGCPLPTRRGRR